MAKRLDDIFDDDEFGLLDAKGKQSFVRSDEDRLVDSFEELNGFVEKHGREPSTTSMAEYPLYARLKEFRSNPTNADLLKPFDRFNLLGEIPRRTSSIDDILDQDDLGLLDTAGDTSIFDFKHTPKAGSRADAEYIAQRKPLSATDFQKYDAMFKQVHAELRQGKRKLEPFSEAERNLKEGHFYLVDGLLAYLEVSNAEKILKENRSGDRLRLEGRTLTVFENGTVSNMLFRSLGKAIIKNGKLVTDTDENIQHELDQRANLAKEESGQSGWIYVLRSKTTNQAIRDVPNLFKIGFSKSPVRDRIKHATKEATFLYADVEIVASYVCFGIHVQTFEKLIHRFFADVCLNVDVHDQAGNRFVPREWFSVPLHIIDEAIELFLSGAIVNYRYNASVQKVVLR